MFDQYKEISLDLLAYPKEKGKTISFLTRLITEIEYLVTQLDKRKTIAIIHHKGIQYNSFLIECLIYVLFIVKEYEPSKDVVQVNNGAGSILLFNKIQLTIRYCDKPLFKLFRGELCNSIRGYRDVIDEDIFDIFSTYPELQVLEHCNIMKILRGNIKDKQFLKKLYTIYSGIK